MEVLLEESIDNQEERFAGDIPYNPVCVTLDKPLCVCIPISVTFSTYYRPHFFVNC